MILLWKDILQLRKGYGFPVFSCLGRNSMGIYIVSGYVIILGIAEFTQGIEPSYAVNLAEMLLVLLISTGFTEIIGQIPAIGRDVIAECDIIGSSDSSISNVTPTDLSKVLSTAPIRQIYANGATAAKLYHKYQEKITGRDIITLPSTSPANAAFSMERLAENWNCIFVRLTQTS